MSARSLLRQLVAEAFPWIERFGLTAKGDLAIKSASSKIDLAGGDKPVARVADTCTQLAFYPGVPGVSPPILYFTNDAEEPKVWSIVALAPALTPPIPGGPSTPIVIITGSEKVSSG